MIRSKRILEPSKNIKTLIFQRKSRIHTCKKKLQAMDLIRNESGKISNKDQVNQHLIIAN